MSLKIGLLTAFEKAHTELVIALKRDNERIGVIAPVRVDK